MISCRFAWAFAFVPLLAGCGGGDKPTPPSAPGPGPHSTDEYKLVGVVREVKPETKMVTIRHEEIPGFMGAMTMPFKIKDDAVFEDLRPGDEVEGRLLVVKDSGEVADYELLDLFVTRPAPPQPLSLNLSGGTPTISVVPSALKVGEVVPDFAVTTQDGEPLSLSELRGKVVVLTFIYTRCPLPDFCPLLDKKFSELADRIGAVPSRKENFRLLSVSIDPEHDTPAVLARHAKSRGASRPLWTFAVASHEELGRIGPRLGLTYGPRGDEVLHNLTTAVIDPEGRLARLETGPTGKSWQPKDLLPVVLDLAD